MPLQYEIYRTPYSTTVVLESKVQGTANVIENIPRAKDHEPSEEGDYLKSRKKDESLSRMKELFTRSGISLDEAQIEKFRRFYELIIRHNDEFDLTRLRQFEDIIVKHFVDSVFITRLCPIPSPLLDIGTGAGFPGIPLKIALPGLSLILAEPRHRRVVFLRKAVEELGLEGVSIYPHMVTPHSSFEVRAVITRALESVEKTVHRADHLLPRGGRIILMKGPAAEDELAAIPPEILHGYRLELDTPYTLPHTGYARRLVVLEKISSRRERTYRILKSAEETQGMIITSRENAKFKELGKLVSIEGIRKLGRSIVPGRKILAEVLKDRAELCECLVIFDGMVEENDKLNRALERFGREKRLFILKRSLYNELDQFSTEAPLLVVRVPELPEWDGDAAPGCSLCVPFQDPVNVGAVIRAAAGFGVTRIIMLREAAHPFHPRSVRASGGTVFSAPLYKGPPLTGLRSFAEQSALPLVSLDRAGEPLDSFRFPESFILLPGVEGPGLPPELKISPVSIPIAQGVESLNAAVAASIALYEWRRGKA